MTEPEITKEKLQAFFLRAMAQGWAADAQIIENMPEAPEEMLGFKKIPFVEGNLRLVDCYYVSPVTLVCSGFTTIWAKKITDAGMGIIPVWQMHYQGQYKKEAIPFLKQALLSTYQNNIFLGGRGPEEFTNSRLWYRNNCKGSFGLFHGEENIVDEKGVLGWHRYSGILLF